MSLEDIVEVPVKVSEAVINAVLAVLGGGE